VEVSVFRMNVSGYQKLRNIKMEKVQQSRRIFDIRNTQHMQYIGIYRGQLAPAYGRTRVAKIAPCRVAADREDFGRLLPWCDIYGDPSLRQCYAEGNLQWS